MTITDKTRKVLWGRSGNRCAICKRVLVAPATADDSESVVGEECHIVSPRSNGPRHEPSFPQELLDGYENLILLCRVHHKEVDDQVATHPAEKLRRIKQEHERWVDARLAHSEVVETLDLALRAGALNAGWQLTLNVINNGQVSIQTENVQFFRPTHRPPAGMSLLDFDWVIRPEPMKHGLSVRHAIASGCTLPFHVNWNHGPMNEVELVPGDCLRIEVETSRRPYDIGGDAIKNALRHPGQWQRKLG